jgi:hypothetical protein
MTKISGRKYAFSNVASDDTLELYFCRLSLLLRNKIFQHVLLLSLELQKIIEEEKKCDENAKVFGAEISLNDIIVGQKSPSCRLSLAGCWQPVSLSDWQACQAVKLSSFQAARLVKLTSCQAVWLSGSWAARLSGCQALRLPGCQAARLADSCQCWSEIPLSGKMLSVL